MTGVQKILARAAGKESVSAGEELFLLEKAVGISRNDPKCGAYGSLYLPERKLRVPRGLFIDLCGVLRNDAASEEVADGLIALCRPYLSMRSAPKFAPEFGGDSLTYLTLADRFATAARLVEDSLGFSPLFECDFLAAEYVAEQRLPKLMPVFNDSPEDFDVILRADLSKI